jgi:hypothetical protein
MALVMGAAVPGHVVVQDRRSVGITSNGLRDFLRALYEAGIRHVQVVVDVAGQRLAVDAVIYRKLDKRGGRAHYWLYPLQPAQTLLSDMLHKWRADAPYNAKRPMPIVIFAVIPKPK